MKRISIIFLQIVVVLIGIGIIATLLYEPTVEGVNANATTLYEIYFDDPFLAYLYVSFIAVFVGLYQAFNLLGFIGSNETYSQKSLQALGIIQYSAVAFAGLMFAAVNFIVATQSGKDDIAGGVVMGLCMVVVSAIAAIVAARFGRIVSRRTPTV